LVVLTTKLVQENIASILDSLKRADLDDAKHKIQTLSTLVKSDKERGELFAVTGIYTSMSKAKDGTVQTWDDGRIERAAKAIASSQMADDFDLGYAEALRGYAKLMQGSQQPAE
jgi:hypothetical protein